MQKANRLKLNKTQLFFHYFFVPVFLCIGAALYFLMSYMPGLHESQLPEIFLMSGIILAILYTFRQYKSLDYTIVETDLNPEQISSKLKSIAESNDWIPEFQSDSVFIYTTMFRWYNWGTLIHIKYTDGKLFFNSICDLYNRPSTISFGRNKKNLQAFLNAFTK